MGTLNGRHCEVRILTDISTHRIHHRSARQDQVKEREKEKKKKDNRYYVILNKTASAQNFGSLWLLCCIRHNPDVSRTTSTILSDIWSTSLVRNLYLPCSHALKASMMNKETTKTAKLSTTLAINQILILIIHILNGWHAEICWI